MSKSSTDSMDQESTRSSNGKPDHQECLRILSLVLDNEASPEEEAIFKEHLENCMPYFEIYSIDKTIRQLIRKNCSDKKLSEEMKNKIRERVFNLSE
ncbi:MAG: zf-HC2 domain-containing protein [Cyclobacteriaceae bacterium]